MDKGPVSIEARGLTKFFGPTSAIRDLSFKISPGEVVGFLGPNGAGKTTTMRILMGLTAASSGEAYVQGHSVARHPEAARGCIGYMAESNPLPEELRVVEYLRLRARLKGLSGRRLRERVGAAMEACDLHRKAARRLISSLSKGYRQRVGIADAVLSEPAVTILDEPTIGLDPHQVLLIRELIARLRGRTTVLLSSHILTEVEIMCDRVIILNHGHLVASGTVAQLHQEFIGALAYQATLRGDPGLLPALTAPFDGSVRLGTPVPGEEARTFTVEVRAEPGFDVTASLVPRLANGPLELREWRRVRPQLEEVFLAATRRGWENHSGPDQGPQGRATP